MAPMDKPEPIEPEEEYPRLVLTGTQWESRRDPKGRRWHLTWEEVAERLRNPPELKHLKVDRPLWNLASYRDDIRKLTNVEQAQGLLLVYEGSPKLNAKSIQAAWGDWCYLAYTATSHTDGRASWRVIIPLTRPVDAPTYRRLTGWAETRLAGLSPSCKYPGQCYYLPARSPGYECVCNPPGAPLDPDSIVQALERSEKKSSESSASTPVVGTFLMESLQVFEERAGGGERPIHLPWVRLATLLGGGLWPGVSWLFGPTGVGKTQFVLHAALTAAREGVPVLYIAATTGEREVVARILSLLEGRPWGDIWRGENPSLLTGIRKRRAGEFTRLPLHLESASGRDWSPDRVWSAAEAMRERYGSVPVLVILDPVFPLREPDGAASRKGIEPHRAIHLALAANGLARRKALSIVFTGTVPAWFGEPGSEGAPLEPAATAFERALGEFSPGLHDVLTAADNVIWLRPDVGVEVEHHPSHRCTLLKARGGIPSDVAMVYDGISFEEA